MNHIEARMTYNTFHSGSQMCCDKVAAEVAARVNHIEARMLHSTFHSVLQKCCGKVAARMNHV